MFYLESREWFSAEGRKEEWEGEWVSRQLRVCVLEGQGGMDKREEYKQKLTRGSAAVGAPAGVSASFASAT